MLKGMTLTGYAIEGYLSLLWRTGMSYLSNRPRLILGTFLIMTGIQLVGFGLLAQAITASTSRRADVMTFMRRVERHTVVQMSPHDR